MSTGVDISRWQKGINLQKVKQEGFTDIIIKAGGADGGLYKDSQFDSFYNQAKACGLNVVGAYFYGKAFSVQEAQKQANYFLSIVQGKNLPYLFYDVEGKMLNQGYSHLTDIIKAFCTVIQDSGYKAGVYASKSPFDSRFDDKQLGNFTHWVAFYSKSKPVLKSGNVTDIWQYGGEINYIRSNKVAGMTVDQDYFYTTLQPPTIIVTPPAESTKKTTHELALEVLAGKYGNGVDRRNNLGSRYNEVQAEVNKILREKASEPVEKTVDQLAVEVLAGVYGNGNERKKKLGKRYAEVQKRVDELIKQRKQTGKTYIVVKGDTLSKIARRYNTTVEALAKANDIKNINLIRIGQELKIV